MKANVHVAPLFASISWTLVYASLLAALAAHLGWQWLTRWRKLRQPTFARMLPEELKSKLDAGENVVVLDLRHPLDRLASPYGIPGAIWLPPQQLDETIPDDLRKRLVVFYCTCPNSASVLNMARTLHDNGIRRIRPLCGGVEAWQRAGFPVEHLNDLSATRTRHAAAGTRSR
jgi:rhodanese-related sulfurtransferase